MSPRKMMYEKQDSSVIDDDEELLEQALESQFHAHPDYHVIDLYEDDDFPEWD
ncbi:MAG: hypothetical protein HKP55_11255 [Gammaproteobacteria bacterium]|nr:hypothetical protein [Gammaproteobacteria bacterium]